MERRLLRLVEVQRLTTLGRTRIYELLAEDRFPRPVRLGRARAAPWASGAHHARGAVAPTRRIGPMAQSLAGRRRI